jgi:probable phosphoglycerate mutase
MLVDRIRPILDDLTRDTVIVAHGGVARAFLAICCGVSSRQAASLDIWQGRVLVIEGRNHRWV